MLIADTYKHDSRYYTTDTVNSELVVVDNPKNPGNKVFFLESSAIGRQACSYLWFDTTLEPGETYKITYDILVEKDATGAPASNPSTNVCFRYAQSDADDGQVKDHILTVEGFAVGKWKHILMSCTVPETLLADKPMAVGIFANPTDENGTSFYIDNVSVTKFSQTKKDDGTITVMCLGNSLLNHGAAAHLGWYGNWGMAASAYDKDYFSVMKKMFNKDFPDVKSEWYREGAYLFERDITDSVDNDYTDLILSTFGCKIKAIVPDIITFQFGDNTPVSQITAESFANALIQCIDFCYSVNPDMKIILSKNFYGPDVKIQGALIAAERRNVEIVDLSVHNIDENKALGQYEHSGVAGHPNDIGMEMVAKTFYAAIKNFVLNK